MATYWAPNEPGGDGSCNYWSNTNGDIHETNCNDTYYYICELALHGEETTAVIDWSTLASDPSTNQPSSVTEDPSIIQFSALTQDVSNSISMCSCHGGSTLTANLTSIITQLRTSETHNTTKTSVTEVEAEPIEGSQYPERVKPLESFMSEEFLYETLAGLPLDVKSQMCYQKEDIILECRYEGYQCTHR